MTLPDTSSRSTAFQRALAIAIVLGSVAVPVVTAYLGGKFVDAAAKRETDVRFVELAVGLLRQAPTEETIDLRGWAIDVIDAHSRVQMPLSVRRLLADSLRWPGDLSVDLKVNDRDGVVQLRPGEMIFYRWSSTGATACELESPGGGSGVPLSGSTGPITHEHPHYPTRGSPASFSISCTDGISTVSDIVTVTQ